jgi:hypothetical protein
MLLLARGKGVDKIKCYLNFLSRFSLNEWQLVLRSFNLDRDARL